MGVPGGTEQREGFGGQRDVAVFGARAAVDMDLEARAIESGDLQEEGFLESESHTVDGGKGDGVVEGCGGGEEPPDLLHTEDGGEMVGGETRGPCKKEDIIDGLWKGERSHDYRISGLLEHRSGADAQ